MKLEDIDMEAAEKYENDKFNAIIEYISLQLDNIDFDESKYNKEKQEYEKKLQYEKEHDIENKLEVLLNLNLKHVKEIEEFESSLHSYPMKIENEDIKRKEFDSFLQLYYNFYVPGDEEEWKQWKEEVNQIVQDFSTT